LALSQSQSGSGDPLRSGEIETVVQKRRKHRSSADPLKRKVRKYRKRCERRTNQVQWIERHLFVLTGIVGGFLALFLIVSLLMDISCDLCLTGAVTIGFLAITTWSVFKVSELYAIRVYRKHRMLQKQRSNK
jgi:hypothetical protein